MQTTRKFWAIVAMGLLSTIVSPATAQYSGGTGEPDDPYQIGTNGDWRTFMGAVSDWNKHFILIADLDLTGPALKPVGSSSKVFAGLFDGDDHVIRNAHINTPSEDYVGLFGRVGGDGQICNLWIENITISADDYIGSLVGHSSGKLSGCHATGSVTGGGYVGGLVGYNAQGALVDCHFAGQVVGSGSDVGGLLGHNHKGTLIACDAAGSASGNEKVGGLVGASSDRSTISDCNAAVDVLGHRYVGGLVGYDKGSISNSYASGWVEGESDVGGLVGHIEENSVISGCCATGDVVGITQYAGGLIGAASQGSTITNCYANGDVSADLRVGGLVGASGATICNAYASGKVGGDSYVGGLVGTSEDWVTDCFWDTETSGRDSSPGGEGRTTAAMKNLDTFIPWACSDPGVWTIESGQDYPRLAWQHLAGQPIAPPEPNGWYDGGAGTAESPYRIATAKHLWTIGMYPCDWDKHFVLVADVNLADYNGPAFRTIGRLAAEGDPTNGAFDGIFDGNDHAIRHFAREYSSEEGYVGPFGWLGQTGQIKNLIMENVAVHAEKNATVGGLVGLNDGTISHCRVGGEVSGKSLVGGLAGWNNLGAVRHCAVDAQVTGVGAGNGTGGLAAWNDGEISDSLTSGRISGLYEVGGLVGRHNKGTISRCCTTGDVSGNNRVGGLVGHSLQGEIADSCARGGVSAGSGPAGGLVGYCSGSQISRSYAAGHISGRDGVGGLIGSWIRGNVTACFWDTQTAGQAAGTEGTGKTTVEMQTAGTFLDAGWDFIGETANGTEDIWWILEGKDYPRLWWELGD